MPTKNRLHLRSGWVIYTVLFVLLALSLYLNLAANNFPLSFHFDEVNKIGCIKNNTQDFLHPVLILKLGKAFSALAGAVSVDEISVAARTSTAILGTLLCGFTFLLARTFLSAGYAFLATALTALSPGIVDHSHFIKEDIARSCFPVASLLFCIYFIESSFLSEKSVLRQPSAARQHSFTLLWGLTLGFAVSSKYTALPAVIYFSLLPMVVLGIGVCA